MEAGQTCNTPPPAMPGLTLVVLKVLSLLLQSSSSQLGAGLSLGGPLAVSGVLVVTIGLELPASTRSRPGMLLNILHHTKQPPQQRIIRLKVSLVFRSLALRGAF